MYDAPKNVSLFSNMGVLSPVEVQARTHVVYESFLKRLEIEVGHLAKPLNIFHINVLTLQLQASTLLALLNTHVYPAAVKHQQMLSSSFTSAVAALGDSAPKALASQKVPFFCLSRSLSLAT